MNNTGVKGMGFGGRLKALSASREKPWWGPRGRSRKFFLNYPGNVKQLNKKTMLTTYVEKTSYFEVVIPC